MALLVDIAQLGCTAGDKAASIRLELDAQILNRLIAEQHIYVQDFRCLDSASKRSVRKILLHSCT